MKEAIRNPFILTTFVPEAYFCDRDKETAQLCKHIVNGRNVALFAKRRLGKTGLIRHCFEQSDIKDRYNSFLVDIYACGNLKEMTAALAREVFSRAGVLGFREKMLRTIRSIRPAIGYDERMSSYTISVGISEIAEPERTLEEILSILDSLKKPAVIAIDEFQKIREFGDDNVEACLRTAFQRCKNIVFIYTGSIGHSMNTIFKSPDKPFYNSAVMMSLDVIDRDVYCEFARRMFRSFGKEVDQELVFRCYDYFSGVTWYNQLLMNEAFAQTDKGGTIRASDFESVYDAIIAQQDFSYQELFSRFSPKQRELLVALALEEKEGAMISSNAFLTKYGLGPASSVQTAGNALKKNNFVTENGNLKQITDLIFRDWIRKNNL